MQFKKSFILLFGFLTGLQLLANPPVPFSGKLAVDGTNFHGNALFSFSIVDQEGTEHWRHAEEQDSTIKIPVNNGRYVALLGGQGMPPLPADLFFKEKSLSLRVSVDLQDGQGVRVLSPDQQITSTPYALAAEIAQLAERATYADSVSTGSISLNHLSDEIKRLITPKIKKVDGDFTIDDENILIVNPGNSENVVINIPTAHDNEARIIKLVPNDTNLKLDFVTGELEGADWAILQQSTEIIENDGKWIFLDEPTSLGANGMIKDIYLGSGSGINSSSFKFTEFKNFLYFVAQNNTNGSELWKTDGSEAGTSMVKDIYPGSASGLNYWSNHEFVTFNDSLYFVAQNGTNGSELWKTDGTEAGTSMVKDIYSGFGSGINSSFKSTEFKNSLYFVAQNDTNGSELWKTDGSEAGTSMVKDIYPGSGSGLNYWSNSEFVTFNDSLYFVAQNGTNGSEIWKTDGTEAGTSMVKDIYPGSGSGINSSFKFTEFENFLYFTAQNNTNGSELWKTDGSETGTSMVKDIYPGSGSGLNYWSNHEFVTFNDSLYFIAQNDTNGSELWKTDGTEAGTSMVKDIYSGFGSGINSSFKSTEFKNSLYFVAQNDTNGSELWKTDGSEAGTSMVIDIYPGSGSGLNYWSNHEFVTFNDSLYFVAQNDTNGSELWKTDGTEAGTSMVKDIYSGPESGFQDFNFQNVVTFNKLLYFVARNYANGFELWKTDGSENGTVMFKDFNPRKERLGHSQRGASSYPQSLIIFKGSIFLTADDFYGRELWKIDP